MLKSLQAATISVMPFRRPVRVCAGCFAATPPEVKRMLAERIQKLNAES
jgi:hypothetical protein